IRGWLGRLAFTDSCVPVGALFCLYLDMDSATLVSTARHDINLGHVAREGYGIGLAFVQLGDDKVFACARNLLIARSTLWLS
ncbi:MAG: hypothetical protein V1772_06280, partial [Chloroflexota bacterium]